MAMLVQAGAFDWVFMGDPFENFSRCMHWVV
jgi:hypothetical protein